MVALAEDVWEPTEVELNWTNNLIRMIKEGGIWEHPMNGNVYQFLKNRKVLCLLKGDSTHWLHINTCKVFRKLGWVIEIAKGESYG